MKMKTTKTNYFFCISTGRSGTNYLETLFKSAANCVATHEPRPRCNGKPMRHYLLGDTSLMSEQIPKKVIAIQAASANKPIYIETSHCFIKGFGWFLPELLGQDNITVIQLKREKSQIVDSYYKRGDTCLSKSGRKYLICPDKKQFLVPPPRGWLSPRLHYLYMYLISYPYRGKRIKRVLNMLGICKKPSFIRNYELSCLDWYVDETFAMGQLFRDSYPAIKFIDITLNQLNDSQFIIELFNHMGLTITDQTREAIGVPVNINKVSNQNISKE